MSAIRVVIADDEPHARRTLVKLVAQRRDLALVGECRNGAEAIEIVRRLEPELLLLDVQMPGADGFGVLRALFPWCPPAVILVTAYDEFAVRAFEAEVLDFLVKPFTDRRYHDAVDRACRRLAMREAQDLGRRLRLALERTESRSDLSSARSFRTHFVVTIGSRSIVVATAEISWIEADDCYARLHAGGRHHLIRESLNQLESELDPGGFARVHRSAIVNLAQVRELERAPGGQIVLVLRDGARLPVSERRRALVTRLFG